MKEETASLYYQISEKMEKVSDLLNFLDEKEWKEVMETAVDWVEAAIGYSDILPPSPKELDKDQPLIEDLFSDVFERATPPREPEEAALPAMDETLAEIFEPLTPTKELEAARPPAVPPDVPPDVPCYAPPLVPAPSSISSSSGPRDEPVVCGDPAPAQTSRLPFYIPTSSVPHLLDKLIPIGFVNGQVVYGLPTNTAPPAAPSKKGRRSEQRKHEHDGSQPYIKKPPNAFIIFRSEQWPLVVKELQTANCGTVNTVIGKRWRSLTKEQQDKYYQEAEMQKMNHITQHPDWSCGDNYGKKRKIRRKTRSD